MPVSGRGARPAGGHIDKRGVAALGDIKIADGVEGNASRLFKGQIEGGKTPSAENLRTAWFWVSAT